MWLAEPSRFNNIQRRVRDGPITKLVAGYPLSFGDIKQLCSPSVGMGVQPRGAFLFPQA